MITLMLWFACTVDSTSSGGTDGTADSGNRIADTAPPPTEITDTEGLYGTAPVAAVALPDFAAFNQLGEPRGPDDLLGHATVIWFYPLAETPG